MAASNELIELLVERIGGDGDGIAHWRSEPVYLPFTVPGDRVRAALGPRRGGGYEGRVVEMLAAGNGRAAPPCRHFARCGGCALQHLDPVTYRNAKLQSLWTALARFRIDPDTVQPLRCVAAVRRRARLALIRPRDPRQPGIIGFRERFRHALVDLAECPILERPLLALVNVLRGYIAQLLPPGGSAEAHLTRTDSGIDLLLTAAQMPGLDALEALASLAAAQDLARIVWRSPASEILVVERRRVRMMRAGVAVCFPPGAFLQASESAEALLVAEVIAAVGTRRPVLDLYAGLGTFGFALAAAEIGVVHMAEGDQPTFQALAQAAPGVKGVSVERRDLARDPMPPETLAKYTAVVLDPPRSGAPRMAEALARAPIDTVVSVSCNPASFARDAGRLVGGGYRLERVTPIDQFVWSPHLELVAVFRR